LTIAKVWLHLSTWLYRKWKQSRNRKRLVEYFYY